ncbi:MAG: DUF948 domain-containing protein [Desulfobulbaceae bacterium]|nr:DUF948 domain-containing protein [Desulfobulbaceae bacterium]
MTPIDLFVIIAAFSLAAMAVVLIPVLLQFRQTMHRADLFIAALNKDLPPLVTTLTDTANEVRDLSASLNDKLDQTDHLLRTLERSGNILFTTSKLLKETTVPIIAEVGALNAGVKAFMYFFSRPNKSR